MECGSTDKLPTLPYLDIHEIYWRISSHRTDNIVIFKLNTKNETTYEISARKIKKQM